MALDRSLVLLRGLPGVSAEELTRRVVRELEILSTIGSDRAEACLREIRPDARTPGLLLYVPAGATAHLPQLVRSLRDGRRDVYQILNDHRLLIISAAGRTVDGVRLAGGSHCEVILRPRQDGWVVTKSVRKRPQVNNADTLHRHQNEAEWLASVRGLSSLFVDLRSISDLSASYSFETEFFPAYSIAELIFQDGLRGVEAAEVLVSVYEDLRVTLYAHRPLTTPWEDRDRTYVDKIRRRNRELAAVEADRRSPATAILDAYRIRVNGRPCPPVTTLLDIVDSEPLWQPVIRPYGSHACHGDLILEDILLRAGSEREVRLVDPNPYNRHGVFDLAKTILSLWIGYELVYFDMFHIEAAVSDDGKTVSVDVSFDADRYVDEVAEALGRFMNYAQEVLADLFGIARHSFRRLVLMASALTALALPSFHVIGHGRPDRALAFVSLGLLHASHALAGDHEAGPVLLRDR